MSGSWRDAPGGGTSGINRRQFLVQGLRAGAGALALGAAGAVGYEWPVDSRHNPAASTTTTAHGAAGPSPEAPQEDLSEVYSFYTRPDLQPPRVKVTRARAAVGRGTLEGDMYVLVSPRGYGSGGPGQAGLMVLDEDGELRWFLPTSKAPFDLQCQSLGAKPVLTWWEGDVVNGTGYGEAVVADMSLNVMSRIREIDGLQPDLHELNLTGEGTALLTAYETVPADLSTVGGPRKGYVYNAVAFEVDVATGRALHRWDSLSAVPVSATYQAFYGGTQKNPFDYFHINSISLTPDGELLISSRNTCAIYKVARSTGKVIWRLGGKTSDFEMGPGSRFYWQHDARWQEGGRVSLFDDGSSPPKEPQSRGLVLQLDQQKMTCTLDKAFVHPARLLAPNQGSVQLLADGTAFVGWGAEPYFSRFSPDGELLVDGRFPTNVESYRAFMAPLVITPQSKPAVVVGTNPPGGSSLYVSWNGSTEARAWRVLAGPSAAQLSEVAMAAWAGFETSIAVQSNGPYFQVVALGGDGQEIGSSDVVKVA